MSETSCCSNPTPSTGDRIAARLDRLPRLATAGVVMALVVIGLAIGGPIGVLPAALGIVGLAFILAVTVIDNDGGRTVSSLTTREIVAVG